MIERSAETRKFRLETWQLVLICSIFYVCQIWPCITVLIVNHTGQNLTNLTVTAANEVTREVRIATNQSAILFPKIESDSDLAISFKDGNGHMNNLKVDCYIETSYGGIVFLILNPSDTRCWDNIHLPFMIGIPHPSRIEQLNHQ